MVERHLGAWRSHGPTARLYSAAGGLLGSVAPWESGWCWVARGINGFGQVAPTEAEAKAAVEAALALRGWRWPAASHSLTKESPDGH
jgi:hypothetical protein